MKKTIESFCENDKKDTIWDLRTMKIIEYNDSFDMNLYQCRTCKCYSSPHYIKIMRKKSS